MKKPVLSDKGKKLNDFLDSKMYDGDFTNDDLVQFIESAGKYLNLQTIPDYAKEHKMSYQGVRDHRTIRTIFNVKFVIDNE
jgi:hypothetical protein